MINVTNEQDFAAAVKNSADLIVVDGDFADKIIKKKSSNAIAQTVAAKTQLNPLTAISFSIVTALLTNYDIVEQTDKRVVLKRH